MSFSTSNRMDINWNALKETSNLNRSVQQHLINVYNTLALAILVAAIGAVFSLATNFTFGILGSIGNFVLIPWLASTSHDQVSKRLTMLAGIAFLSGSSVAPLIEMAIDIDPAIVTSAFVGTSCIFICFSGCAMFAERRSYLYLAGTLSSALTTLCILGFLNIFFHSYFIFNIQLYGGLLLFCAFVVFDTQLVIERAANGRKDFIWDALGLFLDFLNIFVRILIILSKDKKKKKNSKN